MVRARRGRCRDALLKTAPTGRRDRRVVVSGVAGSVSFRTRFMVLEVSAPAGCGLLPVTVGRADSGNRDLLIFAKSA